MRTTGKIIYVTAAVLVLAAGGVEAEKLSRQRAMIESLEAQLADLQTQAGRTRAHYAQTKADLDRARAELASIPPPTDEGNFVAAAERQSWLARTRQLRQLFVQRPDQAIPEMRLLADLDWLYAARTATFDTDEHTRQALAAVRSFAKSRFAGQLDAALRRYTKGSGGQLPADLPQLVPYFDAVPAPDMLDGYTMTRTGSAAGNPTDWAIEAKSVVDPDYDGYFHVQATGGFGSSSGTGAEFSSGFSRAMIAFRQANNGTQPGDPAQLLPYFNPPLDPVREKRFLDFLNRAKAVKP